MRNRSETKASGARWVAALGAVGLLAFAGTAVQAAQVHVDPTNGQVRPPSTAEIKALSEAVRALFARSAQGVQVTEHADGSASAKLGPDSLNVWVATVDASGNLHQVCLEGANAAGALQGAPALEEK